MTWHYNCPECGSAMAVEWSRHKEEVVCRKCRRRHYPPTPDEDHYAYISGQKWPPEMEQVVISRRGTVCVVPGCFASYDTLMLRKPISLGGRICVDNLLPVCFRHSREKGERDYDEWVRELSEKNLTSNTTAAVDLSSLVKLPPPVEPESQPEVVSYVQAIARGCHLDIKALHPDKPVVVAPFLRGPVRRVVFDFEWEVLGGGEFEVVLVAWPRGEEPKLECYGSESWDGLAAKKEIQASRDARGNECVVLDLPPSPAGRWKVAVLLRGGDNFHIKEFVLAGTD